MEKGQRAIQYHATAIIPPWEVDIGIPRQPVAVDILVDTGGIVIAGTDGRVLAVGLMCWARDGRAYFEPDTYDHDAVSDAFGLGGLVSEYCEHGDALRALAESIDSALQAEYRRRWHDDDDDDVANMVGAML